MTSASYNTRELRKIDNGPNVTNSIEVGVFQDRDGIETQVGSYIRNFSHLHRTFYHFRKNNRDFALFSPIYTAIRVMELPSCREIGGEEPHISFCPVDFYVPWEDEPEDGSEWHFLKANFGFVAGVYWGKVSPSANIEFLDLSGVEEGIIKRDQRLGDILMPMKTTLEQAVWVSDDNFDEFPHAYISVLRTFNVDTGEWLD